MCKYEVKQPDGSIVEQEPLNNRWYCHFVIRGDGFHQDENIGLCVIDDYGVHFEDEDGECVDMVSDDLPDYLVLQY